jgi:hypothetical protein
MTQSGIHRLSKRATTEAIKLALELTDKVNALSVKAALL